MMMGFEIARNSFSHRRFLLCFFRWRKREKGKQCSTLTGFHFCQHLLETNSEYVEKFSWCSFLLDFFCQKKKIQVRSENFHNDESNRIKKIWCHSILLSFHLQLRNETNSERAHCNHFRIRVSNLRPLVCTCQREGVMEHSSISGSNFWKGRLVLRTFHYMNSIPCKR